MAIKNFRNRLQENGPQLSGRKDPSLAEHFDLVDFDDRPRGKEVSKENPEVVVPIPVELLGTQETKFAQKRTKPPITRKNSSGESEGKQSIQPSKTLESSLNGYPTVTNIEPNSDQTVTEKRPNGNLSDTKQVPNGDETVTQLISSGELKEEASNGDQTVTIQLPNGDLSDTKWVPDSRIEEIKRSLKGFQTVTKRVPIELPNGNQTVTEFKLTFRHLSDMEQRFIHFTFQDTKRNRSDVTSCLSGPYLVEYLKTTTGYLKKLIRILKDEKKAITVPDSKDGRGGWYIFRIVDKLYSELTDLEKDGKLEIYGYQTVTKRVPERLPDALSSSSNLNTNTTETKETDPNKPALPEEWKTGLDWSALEKFFGQVSVNEKTGVYRAQLGLPANISLQDSPPLTLDDIQNSIDKMTWDYDSKVYTADSTYMTRSRLFGVLMKRGHYNAQAPGFKTRKARQAEQRLRELEEETKVLKAVQDSQFELVQMKWIQTQNLAEIRTKHPIYKIAINDERLLGMVKSHFRQQNYSKVVMENITDHTKLGIDFSLIDQ